MGGTSFLSLKRGVCWALLYTTITLDACLMGLTFNMWHKAVSIEELVKIELTTQF